MIKYKGGRVWMVLEFRMESSDTHATGRLCLFLSCYIVTKYNNFLNFNVMVSYYYR